MRITFSTSTEISNISSYIVLLDVAYWAAAYLVTRSFGEICGFQKDFVLLVLSTGEVSSDAPV